MVRRTLMATLLGGLLLLGAPSIAYAGRGGPHPNGHMGNGSHMGNGMGAGMHRADGRRFDRDDRRFDRDDRHFRHHRFSFIYAPYYYPYYYPCSYSSYYPYSYGYSYGRYYPPRYCPPPYGYDYGYSRPYDSGYGYGYSSGYGGDSGQYGGQDNGQYGATSPGVILRGTAFNPAQLTIKAGQDVVWSWNDGGVTHTVTADDGSFDSGRMTSGTYHHTFDQHGDFRYHCQIHPQMTGTIAVT
jgi:plastocyanin